MRLLRCISLLGVLALSACSGGNDFEVGDAVWIDLTTDTVLRRGHAEGRVLSLREGLVEVQVSRLDMHYDHELTRVLARGTGFVPSETVSPLDVGRSRSAQLDQIVDSLTDAIRTGSFDGPAVELARKLNADLANREVDAALEVMEVGARLQRVGPQSRPSDKLDVIGDAISSLTDIAGKYPDFVGQKYLPANPSRDRDVERLIDGRLTNDSLPVRAGFGVYWVGIVKKVDELEAQVNSSGSLDARLGLYDEAMNATGRMVGLGKAIGVQQFWGGSLNDALDWMSAELTSSYRKAILEGAETIADADDDEIRKLIEGMQADARKVAKVTGDAGVEQKVADGIATFVRVRALKDYDLSGVYSLEDAEELFEEAKDCWAWASKLLGQDVLADKEKESLFLKPVRANIARREEAERQRQAAERAKAEREEAERQRKQRIADMKDLLAGVWRGKFHCAKPPQPSITMNIQQLRSQTFSSYVEYDYLNYTWRGYKSLSASFKSTIELTGADGSLAFKIENWVQKPHLPSSLREIRGRIDLSTKRIVGFVDGYGLCREFSMSKE